MERTAIIEGNYRYELGRVWDEKLPTIGFIMHNPSTANDVKDDPTIRKCIGFARLWGYGGLLAWNLWNRIGANQKDLDYLDWNELQGDKQQASRIFNTVESIPKLICAWGELKNLTDKLRAVEVLHELSSNRHKIYCLGVNKSGQPKHPLYIPSTFLPRPYTEKI
ncbi:MAG: DUF1643 domain-containing protein [Dehalococcoidales bacterium]|nr:DUF1643 domain-containing protein [Dehalococcoidales bacterium]